MIIKQVVDDRCVCICCKLATPGFADDWPAGTAIVCWPGGRLLSLWLLCCIVLVGAQVPAPKYIIDALPRTQAKKGTSSDEG